jgi:hypothetical protein
MVRAVLLGILLASGAACDKSAKPPAAQVEAAAGKVVEVTGKATATRGGASRDLVAGADVFRDDTIDTGADGTITVELFHNNAMWSIDGRKARVDESVAWKLAKQTPSGKPVDHATSSAGRDAERQGAGTRVTAPGAATTEVSRDQATDDKAAPPPTPKPDPKPERLDRGGKDRKGGTATSGGKVEIGNERDDLVKKPESVMAPEAQQAPRQDPAMQVKLSVESQRKELRACLGTSTAVLTINVALADGVATVKVIGLADAKARACVEAVVKKLSFPVANLETTIVIN